MPQQIIHFSKYWNGIYSEFGCQPGSYLYSLIVVATGQTADITDRVSVKESAEQLISSFARAVISFPNLLNKLISALNVHSSQPHEPLRFFGPGAGALALLAVSAYARNPPQDPASLAVASGCIAVDRIRVAPAALLSGGWARDSADRQRYVPYLSRPALAARNNCGRG